MKRYLRKTMLVQQIRHHDILETVTMPAGTVFDCVMTSNGHFLCLFESGEDSLRFDVYDGTGGLNRDSRRLPGTGIIEVAHGTFEYLGNSAGWNQYRRVK